MWFRQKQRVRHGSVLAAIGVLVGLLVAGLLVGGAATADAAAVHRPRPASAVISGQVLGHFDPIGFAKVTVFNADTGRVLRCAVTDSEGYYSIGRLPAGNIKVRASKAGWIPDWASHKPTWATADVYHLDAGQHLSQTWDADMILYLDLTQIPTTS